MTKLQASRLCNHLLLFLLGITYGMLLYWCYMPNTVDCLYCNQPVETSTDVRVCFGHQNVIHFECVEEMHDMLERTGKTTKDFLRTK